MSNEPLIEVEKKDEIIMRDGLYQHHEQQPVTTSLNSFFSMIP